MPKGAKFGGRKAGTPNKITVAAKEAFQIAFDDLGGATGLKSWAANNQTDFYKLYSKLIPTESNVVVSTHEKALEELE